VPPITTALRVTTWNAEWAKPNESRGKRFKDALVRTNSDIIVLTEGSRGLLPDHGHIAEGGNDWGYPVSDSGRRKVIDWSRHELRDVDTTGHNDLPSGRFVSATFRVPAGTFRLLGICIPWSGAHVRTGRLDRTLWQDHNEFLVALRQLLAVDDEPTIVAGDFNQRIPRKRQPVASHELLMEAFRGFSIHTSGVSGNNLIDHVLTRGSFRCGGHGLLTGQDETGPLSDHTGVSVDLLFR